MPVIVTKNEVAVDDRELGQRIAYWRRRRGLTQVIFADRIGRSRSWVVKAEAGVRSAGRLATLDLICEVLRVDFATLIGEEPGRCAAICLDDVEVERIQAALEQYPLVPPDDPPPELDAIQRQVTHAWSAFEFADYDMARRVLPMLIEQAQAAHSAWGNERSGQLLTEVYQIAASTLRKLGEHSLAWLAGDRGMTLARRSSDAATVAATGFRIANALLSMARPQQAHALHVALAENLRTEPDNEAGRALFGHILLHEVSALLALGEGGRALEVATAIDEEQLRILRRERRAALLVDLARAHSQLGNRDQAVRKLLEAESAASREVRCRPLAQTTIADLLRRSRSAPPLALSQLAERSGVRI